MRLFFLLSVISLFLSSCAEVVRRPESAVQVTSSVETDPVVSLDDAADDPAIWLHPQRPESSLIIGTDKRFGIEVYDLDGNRVQRIEAGLTNNVDLRPIENESWSAIAAASNRTENTLSLFLIDTDGELTWLPDSEIHTGLAEVYGTCMYLDQHGPQIFVNDKDGRYQQWLLNVDNVNMRVSSSLVREFSLPSQPEGCVADDQYRRLFMGEEEAGVWTISASHLSEAGPIKLVDIDGEILVADVEGMSLYIEGNRGYLVVSSQGNFSYAVYDRLPPHKYRGSFVVTDNLARQVDGSQETDGLD
ncbi:UNVERIFIED_CONTAM: hypothetical protein GTU68_047225, partial [Idotea baltica]|nr:hypothetical protein [Idotea baltica]